MIEVFWGKVWRELDLTLKNRVLESALRAAGEYSPKRAGIKLEQHLTDTGNLLSLQHASSCSGEEGFIIDC